MMDEFEVAAVIVGMDAHAEIDELLRQFGCQPRLIRHRDLTIVVNRERAFSGRCALASFMRKLECLHVRFDYISLGDARSAMLGYEAALAGLDGLARLAA
jgi:hypothetical protein